MFSVCKDTIMTTTISTSTSAVLMSSEVCCHICYTKHICGGGATRIRLGGEETEFKIWN